MSSPKKPAVLLGVNKNYYFVNDVAYDMHFPIAWAMNHNINDATAKCGPEKCEHCYVYGHINNAFVGYCAYCLRAYDGMRGALYYAYPEPDDIIHLDTLSPLALADRCSYMSGVPFCEIGNPDAMVMERELIVEKLKYYGPTQQEIDMIYGLDLTNYGYSDDKADDFYSFDPREEEPSVEHKVSQGEQEKPSVEHTVPQVENEVPQVEHEKRRLNQYIQDDMYDMRAYHAAPIYSPVRVSPHQVSQQQDSSRHQVSQRQVSPIEIPPYQFTPIQFSPVQLAAYQFSPVQFSPIQLAQYQLSPVQFSPVQISPIQFAPAQFSPRQVSSRQVSSRQVLSRQVSPRQVSPRQDSPRQFSSSQHVSPTQVSLSRGRVPTR